VRVLVATVVHDPRDARVYAREIAALVDAGHHVTYIAPFTSFGLTGLPGVDPVDIPAAKGRNRLAAFRAARHELHRRAPDHDVVLLHSPELILSARDLEHPCIVWDVHEDTAAAVTLKGWLPRPIRRPVAHAVGWAERWAERHWHLILAEDAYVDRFRSRHPVVPNSTPVPRNVPPSGNDRAVYVGHVTRARGGDEIVALGRRLRGSVETHVIGHADDDMSGVLRRAHDRGDVIWHGYLANTEAMAIVQGATVGLALLHDEPNYRHSRPTKIMEYWAQGIPVVSTPLPMAVEMIESSEGGLVVPFADAEAAAHAVLHLVHQPRLRQEMADNGRRWVKENADWNVDGPEFVSILRSWASGSKLDQHGATDAP